MDTGTETEAKPSRILHAQMNLEDTIPRVRAWGEANGLPLARAVEMLLRRGLEADNKKPRRGGRK